MQKLHIATVFPPDTKHKPMIAKREAVISKILKQMSSQLHWEPTKIVTQGFADASGQDPHNPRDSEYRITFQRFTTGRKDALSDAIEVINYKKLIPEHFRKFIIEHFSYKFGANAEAALAAGQGKSQYQHLNVTKSSICMSTPEWEEILTSYKV